MSAGEGAEDYRARVRWCDEHGCKAQLDVATRNDLLLCTALHHPQAVHVLNVSASFDPWHPSVGHEAET